MKKNKITSLIISVLCAAFITGCMSDGEPANISLPILEIKMQKAMDPDGTFRKARSYVQKQMLIVKEGFWETEKGYIVEVKFKRPGKMLVIVKEDNIPVRSIIFNGDNAWVVDYKKKKRTAVKGEQLEKMRILFALGRPGSKYEDIFKEVKLFHDTINGRPYYKIKCISKFEDQEPLIIYVGEHNFLTKRIDVPPHTESIIDTYGLHDGVIIPELTSEIVNGIERRYKLIVYKLNVDIDDNEFYPPTF